MIDRRISAEDIPFLPFGLFPEYTIEIGGLWLLFDGFD